MVELKHIKKYFPANGVLALDGVDFDLRPGEIHALLGENGAGKSTLMHIMAGFIKPDPKSEIIVEGKTQRFNSPAQALKAGIGMVRQRPLSIPGFLVWESCAAGSDLRPVLWVNRRQCRKRIAALDKEYGFNLPLDSPTEALTVSQGQKAAILSLLLHNARYVIFDEPTAVLNQQETENLYKIFNVLKQQGKGIVLISHKHMVNDIKTSYFELNADRVTVLGNRDQGAGSREQGAESREKREERREKREERRKPPPSCFFSFLPFNFSFPHSPVPIPNSGQIIGVSGTRDSGLEALELRVTGYLPPKGDSTKQSAAQRIRAFRDAGGAYLGTRNDGTSLSLYDVLIIHSHRYLQKNGILDRAKIYKWINAIVQSAGINNKEGDQGSGIRDRRMETFSGGQLQRLLLSREMAERGALLVLSEPFRNLDRQYKSNVIQALKEQAAQGKAILVFSTDAEELRELTDDIVMADEL